MIWDRAEARNFSWGVVGSSWACGLGVYTSWAAEAADVFSTPDCLSSFFC